MAVSPCTKDVKHSQTSALHLKERNTITSDLNNEKCVVCKATENHIFVVVLPNSWMRLHFQSRIRFQILLDKKVTIFVHGMICPYMYLCWWTATDDLMLAMCLTPQMSQAFALSTFVQADVTFPGCQVLKYMYLLNIVTFNELTMKWQVVARALMSRMTSAYRTAFDKKRIWITIWRNWT